MIHLKTGKKIVAGLICLALIFIAFTACSPLHEIEKPNSYALFIYMSGADLEEGSGAGSRVLNELLSTEVESNVQIYVQTGGASKWALSGIPGDRVMLYQIQNGSLKVLEDKGQHSMGDQETLADFIGFTKTVEADRKVLLFWGHGSPYGICVDGLYDKDKLTYTELKKGLGDSYFDLIIFNACYTANLDLLTFVSTNADYAIASEEVFPSLGFDYAAMLKLFSEDSGAERGKSMAEIGKAIIEATEEKYRSSSLGDTLTLSLVDLVKVSSSSVYILEYFNNLMYASDMWLKGAGAANSIGSIGKDLFDLENHYAEGAQRLSDVVRNFLLYETHGTRFDTDGIYLFYKDSVSSYDIIQYAPNCAFEQYLFILNHKSAMAGGSYVTFVPSAPQIGYLCDAVLDKTCMYYVSDFTYVCYDEDGNEVREDIIGLFSYYNDRNQNSYITVNEDALFSLTLGGKVLEYRVDSIQSYDTSNIVRFIYSFPAEKNGVQGRISFSYTYTDDFETGYDGISNGEYQILGFFAMGDNTESGLLEELRPGDILTIASESFTYGGESILRNDLCDYHNIAVKITDIYGNTYVGQKRAIKDALE